MRLRFAILFVLLASLIAYVPVQAQITPGGILEVFLKAREAADAPSDQKVTLYQKSKALVIGMDHYSSGWPQLSNGIKDAEEVVKGLTAQGFEVTFKKDLKSRDFDDALRNFFITEGSDPNARLLLWFAGHGDTIDGEAYLVPVDAPSPTKFDSDFRLKAISLRRFGEYMREAKARHVLAIFDSCFSGSVFNVARSLPPPAITLATTQPVREFISSGEAEQQVSDDGTFRRLFLDVLAGKEADADANHDGYVTGTELGLFLHQKMTNLTNNRQTPRYGKLNALGYDRGDFVFQVGKPDVPTATALPPTNDAAQAWAAIKDAQSSAIVEIFLRRYGDGFYGELARQRLTELKALDAVAQETNRLKALEIQHEIGKRQVAAASPPVTPSSPCNSQVTSVSLSSRAAKPLSDAEECALKPKHVFRECNECPEMMVVPAGSFTMGSPSTEKGRSDREDPQRAVTITRAFAVGKFHITRDQFADFVKETRRDVGPKCWIYEGSGWKERAGLSFWNPGFSQLGSHPAVCLSWEDAKAYVAWLSKKTGKAYRLLTEAEWEYAARAPTRPGLYPRYFFGDNADEMCRYGNVADQTARREIAGAKDWTIFNCSDGYAYTAPVGSFLPNAFGLFDMHGNAYQWVEDCWHENYQGAPTDGSAWGGGNCTHRVLRGGSWLSNMPTYLRAAYRNGIAASEWWTNEVGFRVARTLTP